ncbi:MAG: peptidoglycan-binding domain-containing protein [Polyangiaceae bacterium]
MPSRHVVQPGDCIESIALAHGFFPDTLWEHPENAALRASRDNPHVLMPGDIVHIPDLRAKEVEAKTGRVHRFRRRGVPARFRLVLERDGEPRANVHYVLEAHRRITGVTGKDGVIDHFIPPDLALVVLRIGPSETYEIRLGQLLPVTDEGGVRARMQNLGYPLPEDGDDEPEAMQKRRKRAVIRRFQRDHGVALTGVIDDATRQALLDAHGS